MSPSSTSSELPGALSQALTGLVDTLAPAATPDSALREYLDGCARDLHTLRLTAQARTAPSDDAAWLQPFIHQSLARLNWGVRAFPEQADPIRKARAVFASCLSSADILALLRRETQTIRNAWDQLHPRAQQLLLRHNVPEVLGATALLRGAHAIERLAARVLEALALHAAASDDPEAFADLRLRLRGALEDAGVDALEPALGDDPPPSAWALALPQRDPDAAEGKVARVLAPALQIDEDVLAPAVVHVSPGRASAVAATVRALIERTRQGRGAWVAPLVRAHLDALESALDQSDRHAAAHAALDVFEGVRPLLEDDPEAEGDVFVALREDLGDDAGLVLAVPGGAPRPDWEAVDVFDPEVDPGAVVAQLHPGLRLGDDWVRPPRVQVSQGPPPPGLIDELLELLPDDPRGADLARRLRRARCLEAGDAGARLKRELAALALSLGDDELGEAARRALQLVLDDPPAELAEAAGWEDVNEFLVERLETLLDDGAEGTKLALRLTRPYLQGLAAHRFGGAALRSLGESLGPALSLFDDELAAASRAFVCEGLERLGAALTPGGHTRRLLRTASRSLQRFYADQEDLQAHELVQALTHAGLQVYPSSSERLERCPDPRQVFHRLGLVYSDRPRGEVLELKQPAVALPDAEGGIAACETGSLQVSLGAEPNAVALLRGEALAGSRLGPAAEALARALTEQDRARFLAGLRGDASAEPTTARAVAEAVTGALEAAQWARADEEREALAPWFEALEQEFQVRVLPGYRSYRQLRDLDRELGEAITLDVRREGSRSIQIQTVGAQYRETLLRTMHMVWSTGPAPPYVDHLRQVGWFDAVFDGREPELEITPGAREAIQDFDSPEAQSLDGVVRSLGVIVTWLAEDHPQELEGFAQHVKNAPGLELVFFPLPGKAYGADELLAAVERAQTPGALDVVQDAGYEDGVAVQIERVGIYQRGRALGEPGRARFAFKSLPEAWSALREAAGPVLSAGSVPGQVKAELREVLTRLALLPSGEGQSEQELRGFRALLEAQLVDGSYPDRPENPLHRAAAYLSARLQSAGRLEVERFDGATEVAPALAGRPEGAAEVEEVFCAKGSKELVEVRRPLVLLEGRILQPAYVLKGVGTDSAEVLEFDKTLVDTLVRLRTWQEGLGAAVDREFDAKQRQIVPRTIKRIADTRQKMLGARGSDDDVLPPDTARRDLLKFIVDQVHRAEDALSLQGDRSFRDAFGDQVFRDVVFRVAGPYLSKQFGISIDTAVVAGADTQALVGKFRKETSGPKPKRDNAKIFSVVVPCYSQGGTTVRPATVRVGAY